MKVTVYGVGYVGLVLGLCLAELGHDVCCMDIDQAKIDQLQQGTLPIYEPGLDGLLEKNQQLNRIQFTTELSVAVHHGQIQFIAVGTPSLSDGRADLQYVDSVAEGIGRHLNHQVVIVNKSTVPVGTANRVEFIIEQQLTRRDLKLHFDVVSNPEFLREGSAVMDFMHPDRIIIGSSSESAVALLRQLYANIIDEKNTAYVVMKTESAELTKYAANAFLATKISFMNEMSQLAEKTGADIRDVQKGMGLDSRINSKFLNPGCGYGGSCFPKDVYALLALARDVGSQVNIMPAVLKTNQKQKLVLFDKIKRFFQNDLSGKVIALWGLSFKPNTDDIRSASSIVMMEALWKAGAIVQAYDPLAMDNIRQYYGQHAQLRLCTSAQQALKDADVLAILTEWDEFLHHDLTMVKHSLTHPVIFDGRNLFEPATLAQLGIQYVGVGCGLNDIICESLV